MAHAQGAETLSAPPPPTAADGQASRAPQAASPKRRLPDYEGRPKAPADDRNVAVWMLRLLLSPIYFTSEFLLRRPLGALTIAAERGEVPQKLYNFFAFGPDHKLGFVPAGFVEFGFVPSVGIYGFWNDAFMLPHNQLRLHYEVWPDDWFAGAITERIHFHDDTLRLRVKGFRRPDLVFYGLGPRSRQSSQSRFTEARFDASAMLDMHVWRSSRVETEVGLRKVDTSPGQYRGDPSLEVAAASRAFWIPYGFNRDYLDPYSRLLVTFDTRRRAATTGSGFRLELQGEEGADVAHVPISAWIRWGGTATVFVDLNDHGRILSLTLAALFADPLGGDRTPLRGEPANAPIPFTELVSLGGEQWMRGYFPGRLVDRSAAVAQLRYAWPIAPWLGGTLQAAVGNVFAEHLDGFRPDLLRLSAAVGLTTTSDPPIELLAGFGTDTFGNGATVDSFRLSLGVPRSF